MAKQIRGNIKGMTLLVLEIILLFVLFLFINPNTMAGSGENVTVITWLDVGNVFPEILNVSLNNGVPIVLTPNATTQIECIAILRDYNGENDIQAVNATLFDQVYSSSNDTDDNNYHYTNSSCEIVLDAGVVLGQNTSDPYYALSNCTFNMEYYSNASTWRCEVTVNDSMQWTDTQWDSETVSPLLALGVPDLINYSIVNATEVSDEQIANITNFGNVRINLSLEGYAQTPNDGYAMNCSLGNSPFINISYEKFNLTAPTPGALTLAQTESFYDNLTATPVIRTLGLDFRTNDTFNDAFTSSYWRIYVPRGVAGTCTGNIVFGATQAAGT